MSVKIDFEYRNTVLTCGEVFHIENFFHPKIDNWSPVYKDIKENFDINKFTSPRLPIRIGLFPTNLLSMVPDVLRVPLKIRGTNSIHLPNELLPLKDEIIKILQYDCFITGFEEWKSSFIHLTIDRIMVDKNTVDKNTTHRFRGWHGDGFQGGKFKEKHTVEHSYVMTNGKNTTQVALKPFFVSHLNEDRDNIFIEFQNQMDGVKENIYSLMSGNLYLFDPYIVHQSPPLTHETNEVRYFFRLTTAFTELDMPKNTINPMLPGQGNRYPDRIDIREFLSEPQTNIDYKFYGLERLASL